MQSDREEFLAKLAGPSWETIKKVDEHALDFLSHSEPDVRGAALLEFSKRCPIDLREQFFSKCQDLVNNDPDISIRALAIAGIGDVYSASQDAPASRFLSKVVLNTDLYKPIRQYAYLALRQVQFGLNFDDLKIKFEISKVLTDMVPEVANGEGLDGSLDFEFVRRFQG